MSEQKFSVQAKVETVLKSQGNNFHLDVNEIHGDISEVDQNLKAVLKIVQQELNEKSSKTDASCTRISKRLTARARCFSS